jgi:hypothetical protein
VQGKAILALLDFAREIGMQVAPNKINNHTFMKELKASHVNSLVRNVLCNKSQNFTWLLVLLLFFSMFGKCIY